MSKIQTPPKRYSPNWLDDLDGRTAIAQTMQSRWQSLTDDLGGAAQLSYAQRSLATRALWLEMHLETLEQSLAAGGDMDVGQWVQANNSLLGIFNRLGLKRVAKDVNLAEFLTKRGAKP